MNCLSSTWYTLPVSKLIVPPSSVVSINPWISVASALSVRVGSSLSAKSSTTASSDATSSTIGSDATSSTTASSEIISSETASSIASAEY